MEDDWQAINQFSGGDVTIFTKDFENLYGHFERVDDIDTTFKILILFLIKGDIHIYEKNVFTEVRVFEEDII